MAAAGSRALSPADTVFGMTTVRRIDRASGDTGKAKKMPNGWLRVDGLLTRTGVFPYRQPDGSVRRELRLDVEVFKPEALESFSLVPVTDEHPPEFLDAGNTRDYARGNVGETPKRADQFVQAPLFITDDALVAKLETGEARELSCGYTCDLEETPGVTASGERYDVIQRNIRGNHVAVVPKGRAGREAAVRMDAAESVVVRNGGEPDDSGSGNAPHNQEPPVKHTIRIDGIDVEVTTEQGTQTFARYEKTRNDAFAALQAKLDTATAENTKITAQLDTTKGELAKKDAELAALPAKLKAEGKARADLENSARKVLGSKAKLDKLDDTGVRLAVLEKLDVTLGEAKAKDAAYVTARFDAELERLDEDGDEPAVAAARRKVEPVHARGDDDSNADDEGDEGEDEGDEEAEAPRNSQERADQARAKMIKDAGQAWQATAKKHKLDVAS